MPDYLALDWEQDGIYGLDANVQRDRVRVRKSFHLTWPEGLDVSANPQQAGEWLGGELQRLGVTSKQALVSFAREDAVVRQLELPITPDDELPELVRFQAATKSTIPIDQLHLDFLPLPYAEGATTRDVLMATIGNSRVERIRKIGTAAGFEIESISLSSVAAADLVARTEAKRQLTSDDPTLILSRHGERLEITLVRLGNVLTTHSTQLGREDDDANNKAILAEINRLRVSMHRMLPDASIGRVWVFGGQEHAGLQAALVDRLPCDVELLDPFEVANADLDPRPDELAVYAGPLGMMLSRESKLIPGLDFLNPRKPVVKPDLRKQNTMIAAIAILLLLSVGIIWFQMKLANLDERIADRQSEVSDAKTTIKNGTATMESVGMVKQWESGNVDMLGKLTQLNDLLPGTKRVYLSEVHASAANSGHTKYSLQAAGNALNRQEVASLKDRFYDAKYDVIPTVDGRVRSERTYSQPFDIKVQIQHPKQPKK